VSLPEADDPDFESLGIAGHLKCEGDLRGVKDDLFQTIGGEKQNLERFHSKSFSAGPSASSRRPSGNGTAIRISTTGKEMLTKGLKDLYFYGECDICSMIIWLRGIS